MMTVEDIINRLNQYFSWLSSRQWEELALLLAAIAVPVIVIIVLVLRSRRKVLPTNAQLRDIIGIKLADHNTNSGRTDHIEKGRSTHVPKNPGRRKRRKNTKKGFKIAIKELKQRHNEIIKSRQTELLSQQETVRLAAVNEQIQNEVTDSRQVEELPEQKVAEIAAVIEQFQHEITDRKQTEQRPQKKVYEIVPDNEPFKLVKSEQGQFEKVTEESSEQDLKSKKQSPQFDIAEFSKAAISRRQRQRSNLFNEYSDLDED